MQENDRLAAIAALKETLEELRSEEGLTTFVEGHGVMSRRFVWRWSDDKCTVDIELPYACALKSPEEQSADDDEIEAAVKMALLLLSLGDAIEGQISIACDETGVSYSVWSEDGTLEDAGDDFRPLIRRIEEMLPSDAESGLSIIWP